MAVISIEDGLLKKIERIAKIEGTTEDKIIAEAIESMLDKKERSKDKLTFESIAGRFKADKPFNAVEDKRKMRNGEI